MFAVHFWVAVAAPGSAHFGRGRDPICLDKVNCTGTEFFLSECGSKLKGVHKCYHGEDAGVVCSEPTEVRLVNGSSGCSGRVEGLHNQHWASVCDDGWDLADTQVVCRQLGCGTAVVALPGAQFGMGYEPISLDDVNCTGAEAALSECRARPWGDNSCDHREDASVVYLDSVTTRALQPLPLLPLLVSVIPPVSVLLCEALLYLRRWQMQHRAFNLPPDFVHLEELVASDTYVSTPGEEQAAVKGAPAGKRASSQEKSSAQPRHKTPVMQLRRSTQLFL